MLDTIIIIALVGAAYIIGLISGIVFILMALEEDPQEEKKE